MKSMKLATLSAIAMIALAGNGIAQVAGSTTLGVAEAEAKEVAMGWSAKKQILGETIYNDKGEKVGKVEDIIVAPNKKVSYAIIGAGGFAGMGEHTVAIPIDQFKEESHKFVLPGATKEAVKEMPEFHYAK